MAQSLDDGAEDSPELLLIKNGIIFDSILYLLFEGARAVLVDSLYHHSVMNLYNFVGEEGEEIFLVESLVMSKGFNDFSEVAGVLGEVEVFDQVGGLLIMLGIVSECGIGDIGM